MCFCALVSVLLVVVKVSLWALTTKQRQPSSTVSARRGYINVSCFYPVWSLWGLWRSSMERYSVQRVIGEGSFGRALLVRCKSSQEKYVIKEIQLPKVLANEDSNVLYTLYFILTRLVEQVIGLELDAPNAARISDNKNHSSNEIVN